MCHKQYNITNEDYEKGLVVNENNIKETIDDLIDQHPQENVQSCRQCNKEINKTIVSTRDPRPRVSESATEVSSTPLSETVSEPEDTELNLSDLWRVRRSLVGTLTSNSNVYNVHYKITEDEEEFESDRLSEFDRCDSGVVQCPIYASASCFNFKASITDPDIKNSGTS